MKCFGRSYPYVYDIVKYVFLKYLVSLNVQKLVAIALVVNIDTLSGSRTKNMSLLSPAVAAALSPLKPSAYNTYAKCFDCFISASLCLNHISVQK